MKEPSLMRIAYSFVYSTVMGYRLKQTHRITSSRPVIVRHCCGENNSPDFDTSSLQIRKFYFRYVIFTRQSLCIITEEELTCRKWKRDRICRLISILCVALHERFENHACDLFSKHTTPPTEKKEPEFLDSLDFLR